MNLEFAQTLTMVILTLQGTSAAGTTGFLGHAEILTQNLLEPEKCVVDAGAAALTNQTELLIALVMAVDGTKIIRDLVAFTTLKALKPTRCAANAKVVSKP